MLKQLRYFVAIADNHSFSKAAENLFLSTPALTQQMNSLEQEIGCKLFLRSPRGVQLTEAGMMLYKKVKHIIKITDDAISETRRTAMNQPYVLRIGMVREISSQKTTEILRAFCQKYPRVSIESVSLEALPPPEGLKVDLIDLGESPCMENAGYTFLPLGISEPCCEASIHIDMPGEMLTLAQISTYPLSMLPRGIIKGTDQIRDILEEQFPDIRIRETELNSQSVMNAMLRGDLLLSWVSCTRSGSASKLYPLSCDIKALYGLYYFPAGMSTAMAEFIRFARERAIPDGISR